MELLTVFYINEFRRGQIWKMRQIKCDDFGGLKIFQSVVNFSLADIYNRPSVMLFQVMMHCI